MSGDLSEGSSWNEVSICAQMLGAMCEVADALAENIFSHVSGAQWDPGEWLESWPHKCVSGRLVHFCWQSKPFDVIAHKKG